MKKRAPNQKLILARIRENGPSTKYDLADQLKISIPTVTTNINTLIKQGIIEEVGVADVDYGRKPVLIDINYKSCFSLGIDIQAQAIYYSLMNLKFEIVASGKYDFNARNLDRELKNVITLCLEENQLTANRLVGIGISYPGIVDEAQLTLKTATQMEVDYIDLSDLEDTFDVPVSVGNEANLAAFAESIIGSSKDFNNCLYISINQGIGGGIVINKKYYNGSHNAAGEIGHMVIQKNGHLCNCGARGCVEAYLSTQTLIETFNEQAQSEISALNELFERYDELNKVHTQLLYNYLDDLIVTLNNLYLIFDPECITIGGELSMYKAFIEDYLKTHMNDKSSRMLQKNRYLVFSDLGHQASKYGACLIALESLTSLA